MSTNSKIIGVGVDLVDVRRISRLVDKFEKKFLDRYFSEQEVTFCMKRLRVCESLAKMFAIKEGVYKAIPMNMKTGFSLKNVEIFHYPSGKPFVRLQRIEPISEPFRIEVSVSDELPYVCAFVIVQAF
jgi:holo-[acyl-carrier protein] synthase